VRAVVFWRLALIGLRFAIDNHLAPKVSLPSMFGCKSDGVLAMLERALL
jgi:hypothetical protein